MRGVEKPHAWGNFRLLQSLILLMTAVSLNTRIELWQDGRPSAILRPARAIVALELSPRDFDSTFDVVELSPRSLVEAYSPFEQVHHLAIQGRHQVGDHQDEQVTVVEYLLVVATE